MADAGQGVHEAGAAEGRNMNLAGPVPSLPLSAEDWVRAARQEVIRFQVEAAKYVDLVLLNSLSSDWGVLASDLESGDQIKIIAACREYASKGEHAIEPLLGVVTTSRDLRARKLAFDLLRRMLPDKNLEKTFLEGALGTEVADHKANLLEMLHEVATSEAGPEIQGLVIHQDRGVRRAAYALLEKIGPGVFTEAIFHALDDESDEIKADAIAAIGQFKLLMGVKPLLGFIATTTVFQQEKHEAVQAVVCDALGNVGDLRAVPALIAALAKQTVPNRTKRAEVRAAAALALPKLANRDHRDKIKGALEKAVKDPSPIVSTSARRAIDLLDSYSKTLNASVSTFGQEDPDF